MRPITVLMTIFLATAAVSLSVAAAPWLVAHDYPIASAVIYQVFSPFCHQMPSRSFQFEGIPFAVCARCTGVYLGILIGLLVYPFVRRIEDQRMPNRLVLIGGFAPLVLDGLAGVTRIYASSISIRAATGVIAGAVIAWFILPGFVAVFAKPGKLAFRW